MIENRNPYSFESGIRKTEMILGREGTRLRLATFVSALCAFCEFLNVFGRMLAAFILAPPGTHKIIEIRDQIYLFGPQLSFVFVSLGMVLSIFAVIFEQKNRTFAIFGFAINAFFLCSRTENQILL